MKRRTPLPIRPGDLPEPTVVLVSHAHYDHLDIPSYKFFPSRVPVILPKGLGRLLQKYAKDPLIELTTGESYEIRPGLRITAFPVTHFSFRLSGLTYRGCNGYLIDIEGKRIFFPGDTAYRADFKKLRPVDAAFLPIGPCQPEWFMRRRHLNPEDALQVAEEIEAKIMIPIHWGTFKLGMESAEEPLTQFVQLVQEKGLEGKVRILKSGETLAV